LQAAYETKRPLRATKRLRKGPSARVFESAAKLSLCCLTTAWQWPADELAEIAARAAAHQHAAAAGAAMLDTAGLAAVMMLG
jgi:hypothetical protein